MGGRYNARKTMEREVRTFFLFSFFVIFFFLLSFCGNYGSGTTSSGSVTLELIDPRTPPGATGPGGELRRLRQAENRQIQD